MDMEEIDLSESSDEMFTKRRDHNLRLDNFNFETSFANIGV